MAKHNASITLDQLDLLLESMGKPRLPILSLLHRPLNKNVSSLRICKMLQKSQLQILARVIWCLIGWISSGLTAYAGAIAVVADSDGTAFFLDDKGSVWGYLYPDDLDHLIKLPNLSNIKQVVPFAALRNDGRVFTWDFGPGTSCQWKNGGPIGRHVTYSMPKQVNGISDAILIAGMDRHFLALLKNGSVVEFGHQLLDPKGNPEPSECTPLPRLEIENHPIYIRKLGNVLSVSRGIGFDSILTSDGNVYSWGRVALTKDWKESLQKNTFVSNPLDIFVGKNQADISTSDNYLISLSRSGQAYVWGVCLDGSSNQGHILSRFLENVQGIKRVVTSSDSSYSPSAYILNDGTVALQYPPGIRIPGTCSDMQSQDFLNSPTIIKIPSIKISDVALLVGSELGQNWILIVGSDGSVWKILREPFGGLSGFSKLSFP